MKCKLIPFVFLIFTLISSCSDDETDDETIDGQEVSGFLTKETRTSVDGQITKVSNYSYDGNKLIEISNLDNRDDRFTNDFTIEYENELPVRINSYDANNELIEYIISEFENDKITSSIEYIISGIYSGTVVKNEFEYDGNIITRSKYSGDHISQDIYLGETIYILSSTNNFVNVSNEFFGNNTTFSYDTKNSKFKNVASKNILTLIDFSGILANNNNPTAYQFRYSSGGFADYRYEYTYSSNDFPLTMNAYNQNFPSGDYTVQYEY